MSDVIAQTFSFGAFLTEELAARNWDIFTFVSNMGPIATKDEFWIRYLTVELTLAYHGLDCRIGQSLELFAKALGMSPQFLLNIETAFIEGANPCTCEQCSSEAQL